MAGALIIRKREKGSECKATRAELNEQLFEIFRQYGERFPGVDLAGTLEARYGARETRLLAVEQLADFVKFLKWELSRLEAGAEAGGSLRATAIRVC